MIDDLDRTIENLIHHELRVANGEIAISFNQPTGEWSSKLGNQPTLNFYLYDIRENAPLRRSQWQQVTNGHNGEPPRPGRVQLKRTPLLMDCFYMVSAWSPADERTRPLQEHWLLSRCLLALARYPVLNPERSPDGALVLPTGRAPAAAERPPPAQFLTERLARLDMEIRTRLAHHDVLTNPAEVWSALENQLKPGFSYVVTLPLDPWDATMQEAGAVGRMEFHIGQTPQRTDPNAEGETGAAEPVAPGDALHRMGGTVRNQAAEPAEPAPGLRVTLMEADLFHGARPVGLYRRSVTDAQGRFSFHRLLPGEYMVVVGSDLDAPLAVENVVMWDSADTPNQPESNLSVDIMIDVPHT